MGTALKPIEPPFWANISPWEDALIGGDMNECVERLQKLSPIDAVRLVLCSRRSDTPVTGKEIDDLAEHLGVFTDIDGDEDNQ